MAEEKYVQASINTIFYFALSEHLTSSTKIMKTSFLWNQILQVYCDVSSPSLTANGYWFFYKAGSRFCIYCTETMRFYMFRRATCGKYLNAAYPGIWINILYLEKNPSFKKTSWF